MRSTPSKVNLRSSVPRQQTLQHHRFDLRDQKPTPDQELFIVARAGACLPSSEVLPVRVRAGACLLLSEEALEDVRSGACLPPSDVPHFRVRSCPLLLLHPSKEHPGNSTLDQTPAARRKDTIPEPEESDRVHPKLCNSARRVPLRLTRQIQINQTLSRSTTHGNLPPRISPPTRCQGSRDVLASRDRTRAPESRHWTRPIES